MKRGIQGQYTKISSTGEEVSVSSLPSSLRIRPSIGFRNYARYVEIMDQGTELP